MQDKEGWTLIWLNTALLNRMDFGLFLAVKPEFMRISGVYLASLSLTYTTC